MKRTFLVVAFCIALTGCGANLEVPNNDNNITREEVNEIVEQKIQEHEELESDQDYPEEESLKTNDGKFFVDVLDDDPDVIRILQSYSSYEVESNGDDYLHKLVCVNSTNKTIEEIYVTVYGDYITGGCSVQDVAPGEEMVFEYHSSSDEYPFIITSNYVIYAEE